MRKNPMAGLAVICAWFLLSAPALSIAGESREMTVTLSGAEQSIEIAKLHLMPKGDHFGYTLELNDAAFSPQFLSMRPFRCAQGPKYWLCHLAYDYPNRRTISHNDLIDLEYDLLFIRKLPSEFGIDPWNGVYYRLHWDGDGIVGKMHEVDLNVLAAPPEKGDFRPIPQAEISEADAELHWLPELRID